MLFFWEEKTTKNSGKSNEKLLIQSVPYDYIFTASYFLFFSVMFRYFSDAPFIRCFDM